MCMSTTLKRFTFRKPGRNGFASADRYAKSLILLVTMAISTDKI